MEGHIRQEGMWRWWELVHGLLVTRGFAVRIMTALRDMGVDNNSCSGSCSGSCSAACLCV
jgi:hypothetical protein